MLSLYFTSRWALYTYPQKPDHVLSDYLEPFTNSALVCIDHGRFDPSHADHNAITNLKEAFEFNLIDIYFCAFRELWNFCYPKHDGPLPAMADSEDVKRVLTEITPDQPLPLITVVRDMQLFGSAKVYLIVGEKVVLPDTWNRLYRIAHLIIRLAKIFSNKETKTMFIQQPDHNNIIQWQHLLPSSFFDLDEFGHRSLFLNGNTLTPQVVYVWDALRRIKPYLKSWMNQHGARHLGQVSGAVFLVNDDQIFK